MREQPNALTPKLNNRAGTQVQVCVENDCATKLVIGSESIGEPARHITLTTEFTQDLIAALFLALDHIEQMEGK
jgi:hypothetical protein